MAVSGLIFGFGPFQFDPKLLTLTREGNTVQLTPKVADLLERLASAPGEVLSKETLLASVWPDTFVEEGTLTFHIHALRQALGDEAARPRFIQTVPRRGYRFIASVREIARESGAPIAPSKRPDVTAPVESDAVGGACARPETALSLEMPNDAGHPPESRRREPLRIGIKAALIVLGSVLTSFVIGVSIQANAAPRPRIAAVRRLTFDRREKGAYYLQLGAGRLLIDVGAHQFVLSLDGTGHLAKSPFEPFHLIDVSAVRGVALANRRDDAGDEMGLWMVSLTGGKAKRVGEVRTNAASWSHNGEWIAYADGEHALYVTDATGTAVRRLATFSGSPGPPLWSPNDKVIRIRVSIASDRQFRSGVMEVPLDGSSSREVVKVPENDAIWNGGWLSDSSYLYCGKTTSAGCLPMTLSGHESETGGEVSGAPLSPIRFQTLSVSPDGQRIYGTVTSPSELSRYNGDRQTGSMYSRLIPRVAAIGWRISPTPIVTWCARIGTASTLDV